MRQHGGTHADHVEQALGEGEMRELTVGGRGVGPREWRHANG